MPYIHKDMLVVLESTTYPGTTEELCKPILEEGPVSNAARTFILPSRPSALIPAT